VSRPCPGRRLARISSTNSRSAVQLVVHPEAQAEIVEAVDWYEQRAVGLGEDLFAEIEAALRTIANQPHTWGPWPGTANVQPPIQRYLLARFRFYALAFQTFEDRILVLSVCHMRRRPHFWLERSSSR
jgi:toxin ParE1/3/4